MNGRSAAYSGHLRADEQPSALADVSSLNGDIERLVAFTNRPLVTLTTHPLARAQRRVSTGRQQLLNWLLPLLFCRRMGGGSLRAAQGVHVGGRILVDVLRIAKRSGTAQSSACGPLALRKRIGSMRQRIVTLPDTEKERILA
jgi:hypothetical protein